jgi:hypothetical protein
MNVVKVIFNHDKMNDMNLLNNLIYFFYFFIYLLRDIFTSIG